jgi:hypothetical protein
MAYLLTEMRFEFFKILKLRFCKYTKEEIELLRKMESAKKQRPLKIQRSLDFGF